MRIATAESDANTIERIKRAVADFERRTGRVPTIRQLAVELSIHAAEIGRVIRAFLSSDKAEGSSVFKASLLEILLSEQLRQRDHDVLVIDENGERIGILSTKDALNFARAKGLDLFIIQADANPPVARIMDYGRFRYSQEKKVRETKRKHHAAVVKEIKLRMQIADADYQVKVQHALKVLRDGDKIKTQVILRGKEMQKADLAVGLSQRFAQDLQNVATIEREPEQEGKLIMMVLAPARPVR